MNIKVKILTFAALIFCALTGLLSCGANQQGDGGETNKTESEVENIMGITPEYPENIGFDDYRGRREMLDNNIVGQDFMDSVKSFAFTSASEIFTDPKNNLKNMGYSPVSLYMALAVASTGAETQTKDEMFSLLEIGGKDKNYLSGQMGNLFRTLYFSNEIGSLKIANSLWMQEGWRFKSDFTDNAVKNFYSSIYNVDFKDKNTEKSMGKWVSDNTNGVIEPDIKTNNETILAILNTVYFKDEWLHKINKDNTKKDKFYLDGKDGDNYIECDFMQAYANSYVEGGGFISSELYLKNNGSMIFVLPDKGADIIGLLSDWRKFDVIFGYENRRPAQVTFKIPKFSYGNKIELTDVLKSLGMEKAFDKDLADFSAMSEDPAFISDVKQEVHVAIDEKGVEAAAFTSVMMEGGGMPPEIFIDINLNRPFIYFITDRGGVILFMGVIYNPAEN